MLQKQIQDGIQKEKAKVTSEPQNKKLDIDVKSESHKHSIEIKKPNFGLDEEELDFEADQKPKSSTKAEKTALSRDEEVSVIIQNLDDDSSEMLKKKKPKTQLLGKIFAKRKEQETKSKDDEDTRSVKSKPTDKLNMSLRSTKSNQSKQSGPTVAGTKIKTGMFGLSRNSNAGAASTSNLNMSKNSNLRTTNRSQVSQRDPKEEQKEMKETEAKPKKTGITQRVLGSGSKIAKPAAPKVNIEEAILEQLILGDIDLSEKSK